MGFRFRSAKLSHAEVKAATSRTNRTNPPEFQTPDFRPSLVASNAQSRKIKTGMTVEPPTIAAQNVGKLSRRIAAVNARNSSSRLCTGCKPPLQIRRTDDIILGVVEDRYPIA
jgi:hypothetical protein